MSTPVNGGVRKGLVLAIACAAVVLLTVDLTVLHLAIPKLTSDLDPSATQILWIADIYGFVLAGLLITMGSVGDRIGRKKLLLIGTVAFGAASLLTAYAPNAEMLMVARVLLGAAGATIMPSTLSILRNVFTDPKERTAAIGLWSGMSASGFVLGPIIGGALLNHFWWGSVFLINIPILLVLFIAALVFLPESSNPVPGRLDLLSVVLSTGGVIGLVYAVKEAAHEGIAEPAALGAGLAGLAAITLFVVRQTKLEHPLIDVRLFRRAAFTGAVTANMFAMFAMVAQSLIFAQYFQLVLGWSPLTAGLAGLPGAAASAIGGGALAAPMISAIGRAKTVGIGLGLGAIGLALYTTAGMESNYLMLVVAMVPVGIGFGMAFAVTGDTVLATVPKERAGSGAAISETAMEVGGALGIAVLGSALNSAYTKGVELPDGVPAPVVPVIEDSIAAAAHVAATLPAELAAQVMEAARHAFVDAFHVSALVAAGVMGLVALVSLATLRGVPKVIEDEQPGDESVQAYSSAH
ncbi:MFS transporter [Streptomyces sp. NPDC057638]|uniref:MFS transporter n=1 Tax=Streptomyces sp. NPDC057638 TaxID=3346190 RepID=UPI0036930054